MKAITVTTNKEIELVELPEPDDAREEHIIIKMRSCGINAGDKAFINGIFPKGSIPESRYSLAGVSGVGTVIGVGKNVPAEYKGQNVTIYRSLKFSEYIIGTWSEYSHLHYLQCAIVPDNLNIEEYSGSLVNTITPYAFFKHITEEGHKGIICTAGNSATGIAMLGICLAYDFSAISIVRNDAGKKELEKLGAKNIVIQNDADFKENLKEKSQELSATAIFDGVGGSILTEIIDILPFGSAIYAYGYLGGQKPFSFHTSILMKGVTIKSFNNFRSSTVQDPNNLQKALKDIESIINMPHFKTKTGKKFTIEEASEALQFPSTKGEKVVICF